MDKRSISVREMQHILGLGKGGSYWLVKKKYFETIVIAGKMRVLVDSFEDWYAHQFHYKKVDGTLPGSYWKTTTMSLQEAADLLGIKECTIYALLRKKRFHSIKVGVYTRICKDSFEKWYSSQTHYKKITGHGEVAECSRNELQS